jgi:hypothetical protein
MEERTLRTTDDSDLGAEQREKVPPDHDPIGLLGLKAPALASIRFGESHLIAAPESRAENLADLFGRHVGPTNGHELPR